MPEMQPEERQSIDRFGFILIGVILGGMAAVLFMQSMVPPNIPQGHMPLRHVFTSTAMMKDANVAVVSITLLHRMGVLEKKALEIDARHFIRTVAANYTTDTMMDGMNMRISENFVKYLALPCGAFVQSVTVKVNTE